MHKVDGDPKILPILPRTPHEVSNEEAVEILARSLGLGITSPTDPDTYLYVERTPTQQERQRRGLDALINNTDRVN